MQISVSLPSLEEEYASAWEEWSSSGDQDAWDVALADGLLPDLQLD